MKNAFLPIAALLGLVGLILYNEKEKSTLSGLAGLPVLSKKEDYPYMWREKRAIMAWANQKLQPDYQEQAKDLEDSLKNYMDKVVEQVGWAYTGNYGSELAHLLQNQYVDIVENKVGKNIVRALRALAIESFMYWASKEYSDLNAAKVRSIVKKTLGVEGMEKLNNRIVQEEILMYESDGQGYDLSKVLEKPKRRKGSTAASRKLANKNTPLNGVDQKTINQIAAKLKAEGVTHNSFSKRKANLVLRKTVAGKGLIRIVDKNTGKIKTALKKLS